MTVKKPVKIRIEGKLKTLSPKEANAFISELIDKARELHQQGDLSNAIDAVATALRIDDTDIEGAVLLGDLMRETGDYESSLSLYNAAYESGLRDADLYAKLLGIHLLLGNDDETRLWATRITKIAPKRIDGWQNLTDALIRQNKITKAANTLQTWKEKLGQSEDTDYYDAILKWYQGDLDGAAKDLQVLIDKGTAIPNVYHYVATYYYSKELYKEMIPFLEKYLQMVPNDDEAKEVLAEGYAHLKDTTS